MIVGHNPGLEELLKTLCGEQLPYTTDGKLLTTGNLAEVEFPDDCTNITDGCGRLLRLMRPGDLA
jgi:phosphohistidine phosphatase